MNTIRLNVKALREKMGWSVAELAKNAGISVVHVYNLESGRARGITFRVIAKLLQAFGCPLDELLIIVGAVACHWGTAETDEGYCAPPNRYIKAVTLNVKQLRQEMGWSVAELAARAGVSRMNIYNLESGRAKAITFEMIAKLLNAFECSLGDLLVVVYWQ